MGTGLTWDQEKILVACRDFVQKPSEQRADETLNMWERICEDSIMFVPNGGLRYEDYTAKVLFS
jgi:hypothetical protein